ncbi:hybrid sensor histidine kinase/response regulator [Desulfogranum japonicum]|uniref:hybrid sensor histidine kinase/response regulator n=1 Tax=Desulfogranum japonicum TaxID=231447 RepID=UPI000418DC1B|nr:PAS domain-containing sensor histidine kinase [Desulfogranum japonicum]
MKNIPAYEELLEKIQEFEQREFELQNIIRELQACKKKLEEVCGLAGLGFWTWQVSTGKVTWSPEVYDIFGLSPTDFTPTIDSILALSPWPEEAARGVEIINTMVGSNTKGCYEQRFLRADGSIGYYRSTFNGKTDNDGHVSLVEGVVIDISERKRIEKALLQSQKMEAIGTLAGGIAHDFNNILSAILGYAQLAQLTCPEDEKIQKYATHISTASIRAKDLVNQILDFSRQRSLEKRPVEIGVICKEALKLMEAIIPANIQMHQFFGPDGATVHANATQIHQIVVNLCTNAAHAMQDSGGELVVELVPFTVGSEDERGGLKLPTGKYLKLTVSDTGSGIPRNILPQIFEPYFTTKEVGDGTGIGLATVRGIVRDHGGDIKVDSEQGIGTTFHVFLPTIDSGPVAFNDTFVPLATGTEQILIIDDEKFIVEIGREMLSGLGYRVDVKTDPLDALWEFHGDPDKYDLVITDWTMPNMNGARLIKELKKVRESIPIVLCTGFSKELILEGETGVEADAILRKPITMHTLAQTVKNILSPAGK